MKSLEQINRGEFVSKSDALKNSHERNLGNYVITVSGKRMYIKSPKEEDICIEDIAHGLSQICRFNGQMCENYSIAEHCINVASLVKGGSNIKLAALLHDAAEAYIGDIIQPVKSLLKTIYKEDIIQAIEENILSVIFSKFGLQWPFPDYQIIHNVDIRMVVNEYRRYFPNGYYDTRTENILPFPASEINLITPLSSSEAKKIFIEAFKSLTGETGPSLYHLNGRLVIFKK